MSAPDIRADVSVNELFSDHMVVQRDMPVPIWGTAEPGESVTLTLGASSAVLKADTEGKWLGWLGALAAGGPFTLVIEGKNRIVIDDVFVGEVWLCSGQSNMQMAVRQCRDSAQEIAAAQFPQIREFQAPRRRADAPQTRFTGGRWSVCSPETVGSFTGVGYFFARELHRVQKVPVGLIHAAWGGTTCEAWMPDEFMRDDPEFKPIYARWDARIQEYLSKTPAEREKKPATQPVKFPDDPRLHQNRPAVLFNRMIHPAVPYAIRGVLWYQGEANVDRAYQYRRLFPTLITAWRRYWKRDNLPFLFVQLSNYENTQKAPYESELAELREAQAAALSLPAAAMVVATDIGDGKECHAPNKQEISRRLWLAALALAYGEKTTFKGPTFASHQVDANRVRIRFSHVEGGLVAKGAELKGFAVAGADRRFIPATARIDGEAVIVESDGVNVPVAVRYNWADSPDGNLYNSAGLPAPPFRTDHWPGLTANAR